ncbi:NTP transferase domain-containing protein [Curtobacterium sp. ISL-83]|uniref:nucleotidyltransferase family protein n=1 Tax=Curtobacterium sp. ISL-83 TaxID=2819145 RepID=UPI001BE8A4C7|nr:nucleotidyltransferase family protein [Curtobacterium sp. ISL-83]MBT2501218.1 nucleotidyltransferase family protein [Curtobacterium sp. ISL-83]
MTGDGTEPTRTVGVVLAAGAGTRMGRPKALVADPQGRSWVRLAVTALLDGGCSDVVVVLGAAAREARLALPDDARVRSVVACDWERGLSASLLAGLDAVAADPEVEAALVTLVDLPRLPAAAVRRVLGGAAGRTTALAQAVYADRPGHPVLLGRAHWPGLMGELAGDHGAGAFLRRAGATRIDCGDLWDGRDQDRLAGGGGS